jgi:Mn-containing catalase
VPEAFPLEEEHEEFARVFLIGSDGPAAADGRWASGEGADGRGPLTVGALTAHAEAPVLPPGDPRLYGTPPADGAGLIAKVKDALT